MPNKEINLFQRRAVFAKHVELKDCTMDPWPSFCEYLFSPSSHLNLTWPTGHHQSLKNTRRRPCLDLTFFDVTPYERRAKPLVWCSAHSSQRYRFFCEPYQSFLRVWTHLATCTRTLLFLLVNLIVPDGFPHFNLLSLHCCDAAFIGGFGSCSDC